MIQLIYDGLSIQGSAVVYEPEYDSNTDIMNTVQPDIYKSEFGGNIYYFGYTFKNTSSRKDRTTIIHWIKGIECDGINDSALKRFIDKPLRYLDNEINLSEFTCIVYPRSNRSHLTQTIIEEISNFSQRDTVKTPVEFVKSLPQDVYFDWEDFDLNYPGEIGDNQYKQIRNYIENILLPKIHSLDYFSLADNVKAKYRRYIKDYLNIDERSKQVIKSIQSGKILVVDDINTTGATMNEILRIIRKINNKCEVYIFTLIGKE